MFVRVHPQFRRQMLPYRRKKVRNYPKTGGSTSIIKKEKQWKEKIQWNRS